MKVEAKYEVRYMIKKVHGISRGILGELKNGKFFIVVPVKSFVSGDAEQDSHMLEVTEASLFPTVSAKGEFYEDHVKVEIEFHGISRNYQMSLKDKGSFASFVLDLEAHGIKRPSFLGIKIKNDVLMTFKIS